jgi:hypothetical protein
MDDLARRDAEAEFIATLYGDPIREPTAKLGRQLFVTSLLLIAVMKFGAEIDSSSLFPLKFKEPDILPTGLSVAVALLLLSFVFRVVLDSGLLIEGERRITRFIWQAKEQAAVDAARGVDEGFAAQEEDEGPDPDPDPWWEPVAEVRQAAAKAEEDLSTRLGRRTAIRYVRWVRAGGEVLLPLVAALAALILAYPNWHWPDAPHDAAARVPAANHSAKGASVLTTDASPNMRAMAASSPRATPPCPHR